MFLGKLFVWHFYVTVYTSYKGDTGEELKKCLIFVTALGHFYLCGSSEGQPRFK